MIQVNQISINLYESYRSHTSAAEFGIVHCGKLQPGGKGRGQIANDTIQQYAITLDPVNGGMEISHMDM